MSVFSASTNTGDFPPVIACDEQLVRFIEITRTEFQRRRSQLLRSSGSDNAANVRRACRVMSQTYANNSISALPVKKM